MAYRTEPKDVPVSSPSTSRRAAVVVNPTKFTDLEPVRQQVSDACVDAGWQVPLWLPTTAEDPGEGQTRQALGEGVDLVCPLGGDGTVRTVAEAMVHTGVPVGLLPGGTGNLLARNLGLPHSDLGEAVTVALTGRDHPIDVGVVRFDVSGDDQDAKERVFLVMAGFGFDAAMMADTPERLKSKVGWLAYAVSGFKNLNGPRVKVRIKADGEASYTRRVQTVLVGNCGKLTGGIVLLPEAELDDGWLDAVTLSPSGVIGWAAVAARVLHQSGHSSIDHIRCRELRVSVEDPQEGQLDGDTVGPVRGLRTRIDPGALLVRMPAEPVG